MTEWLCVRERSVDVRRQNRDGHGGYPVGSLMVREVLARVVADSRTAARAKAPAHTDAVLSVLSLLVADPDGWLRIHVGEPRITQHLFFQSELAREMVSARLRDLLRVA
jgi:hypothetical protein